MYNLDSLSLKYLIDENRNFLEGAVVQKIQMPSRREILLSVRNSGENRKLYINIDPKFAHLNLIYDKEDYFIRTKNEPPMFCMLLRKYIEGAKLKVVKTVEYERIAEFYFDIHDEIGSLSTICLALEFMGKHSNAVLYSAKTKIIAGCVHNISQEKSSVREIYGGIPYVYPPKQDKTDILKTSFAAFCAIPVEEISKHYHYLSGGIVDFILQKCPENKREELFQYLQKLTSNDIETVKDFWIKNIEDERQKGDDGFSFPCEKTLNNIIEKYFSRFVLCNNMESKKSTLRKIIKKEIKRRYAALANCDKKKSYLLHKQKGEIILANIYKIKSGDEKFTTEGIEIALDKDKTPSQNAQKYFALYNKGKRANEVTTERAKIAKEDTEYLEGVLFSVENAKNPDILDEIREEIDEFTGTGGYKKAGQNKKTGGSRKIEVQTVEYMGFTIYVGRNNKQNDYLIKKISSPEDIWLHTRDCPSGHVFIKTENGKKTVPDDVLLYAANFAKLNSPAKESNKVSVIYTKRKFIKRPPETRPGYVTYREEREIVV